MSINENAHTGTNHAGLPGIGVDVTQQAAVADPAAYVGVDVAAAGPAQVALLSELNDTRAVVVTLIARLEAAGILAP